MFGSVEGFEGQAESIKTVKASQKEEVQGTDVEDAGEGRNHAKNEGKHPKIKYKTQKIALPSHGNQYWLRSQTQIAPNQKPEI